MAKAIEVPADSAPRKNKKDRLLMQIKSLDEKDDERTSISKRMSWILRGNAKQANVKQDQETKWVKFTDMCECDILKEYTQDLIMKVVVDFNGKKLRYELKEEGADTYIRAYTRNDAHKKEQRKADVPTHSGGLRAAATEFKPKDAEEDAAEPATPAAGDQSPSAADIQAQVATMAALQQQMWFAQAQMMNPFMMQAMANLAQGKYHGWIKSFNTQKGFGFIHCNDTLALYQRDVFLHKAQIGDLKIGSFVSFRCEVNKQGMPQAKDLQFISAGATDKIKGLGKGKDGGKGKGGKGKGKGKGEGGKKGDKAGDGDAEKAEPAAAGEAAQPAAPAAEPADAS